MHFSSAMVNAVQVGMALSVDAQDCVDQSEKSATPFADALSTAMTPKQSDDTESNVAAANATTNQRTEMPPRKADKTLADDEHSEITAMLTILGSVQPVTVPPDTRGGASIDASIHAINAEEAEPAKDSENERAENNLPQVGAIPTKLSSTQTTTVMPQSAILADDASADVCVPTDRLTQPVSTNAMATVNSATSPSSVPDKKLFRLHIPAQQTDNPVIANDTPSESLAPPAQATAQNTPRVQASHQANLSSQTQSSQVAGASDVDTPAKSGEAARDGNTAVPNAVAVIASSTGILDAPKLPAQTYATSGSSIAEKRSALDSLDDVKDSPANIHTQGEELAVPADGQQSMRDRHAQFADLRRKVLAPETPEHQDIAVRPEQAHEMQALAHGTEPIAPPSIAAATEAVTPAATAMPAVLLNAEHVETSRQTSPVGELASSDKGLSTKSFSTPPPGADITHAHEVIQSARMLERLGRAEMQVGINTDMGHVEVRTVLQNAHVSATFGVERSELGALINAELPSLQHALAKNHLDLSSASVNTNGAGAQGDLGRNAQQQRNQNGTQDYTLPPIHAEAEERGSRTSLLLNTGFDSQNVGGLSVRA